MDEPECTSCFTLKNGSILIGIVSFSFSLLMVMLILAGWATCYKFNITDLVLHSEWCFWLCLMFSLNIPGSAALIYGSVKENRMYLFISIAVSLMVFLPIIRALLAFEAYLESQSLNTAKFGVKIAGIIVSGVYLLSFLIVVCFSVDLMQNETRNVPAVKKAESSNILIQKSN